MSPRRYDETLSNGLLGVSSSWAENTAESKAVRDSGMHHIRYDQDRARGIEGRAPAMASLLAAVVPCLRDLDAAPASAVSTSGPSPRAARYEIVDPVTDPPDHWPGRATARHPDAPDVDQDRANRQQSPPRHAAWPLRSSSVMTG